METVTIMQPPKSYKERYPGEYKDNLNRSKEKRKKAAEAREEQRKRLLVKSGTKAVPKPKNIKELIKEANDKFRPINSKQFGRYFNNTR